VRTQGVGQRHCSEPSTKRPQIKFYTTRKSAVLKKLNQKTQDKITLTSRKNNADFFKQTYQKVQTMPILFSRIDAAETDSAGCSHKNVLSVKLLFL
jgi:hypothetical protein